VVGKDSYIAVYVMADGFRGTLYIGVTSNLMRRVYEHREGLLSGFTKTYGRKRLVWYEPHETMLAAIQREKSLKRYRRD
jgi:putative endonuclease